MNIKKMLTMAVLAGMVYGCGGGGGSDDSSPTPPPGGGGGSGEAATISGKLTFDQVPHNQSTNGLNHSATVEAPIRGVTVQLLDGSTVVDTDVSDASGNYSFDAETGTSYRIRIRAELKQSGTQSWDIEVVDNTSSNAQYVLDTSTFTVSSSSETRDINADSGWGGSSYTSTRAAAPFNILDRVYVIIQKLQNVDSNLTLDPLVINWSVNNIPESGNLATGRIGTSFYTQDQIYLLGAANTDSDEYDGHVIIHEWGHYFEDNNARSDSIGGPHGGGDRLDMRVAFGEGFGNAWSGIITDDPFYRDSFGTNQSQGFSINVENNNVSNPGWFSEGSVQSILYDVYDGADDDLANLGLQPIYDVLTGQQRNTEAFTSIFSFMTYLKAENTSDVAALNDLLNGQNIDVNVDIWGSNETDNEGQPSVIPVYNELSPGDTQEVCTITTFGNDRNKLGNRKFLRLNIQSAGNYTLRLTPSGSNDLDGYIYNQGQLVAFTEALGTSTVDITENFAAGTHVADVLAYNSSGSAIVGTCFDVSLIQN